jgi:hypothetical protein
VLVGLLRGKIRWTIPGAGTAYSVLHFGTQDDSTPTQADADEANTKMDVFCTALRPYLPSQVQIQTLNEMEEIVATTGAMLGVYTSSVKTVKTGSATAGASWAAAAGAVITWNTAGVRNSRRVRGRNFIVPLSSTAFDTDGTLNSTTTGGLGTAATDLRASSTETQLVVWARPTTPGGTDGAQFEVTSHRIPDMSAILTSRRS